MGQTDRPDDRRAAGSRLPSNSESAVKRNHETPKSGISKRKKIEACPRLSCKIEYLPTSNHRDQSTTSEYFTDDVINFEDLLRLEIGLMQQGHRDSVYTRAAFNLLRTVAIEFGT